jgi:hypothetical protein
LTATQVRKLNNNILQFLYCKYPSDVEFGWIKCLSPHTVNTCRLNSWKWMLCSIHTSLTFTECIVTVVFV